MLLILEMQTSKDGYESYSYLSSTCQVKETYWSHRSQSARIDMRLLLRQ
jgi:hypothetical protein